MRKHKEPFRLREWLAVTVYLVAATLASAGGFVLVSLGLLVIDADIDPKLGIVLALGLGTLPALLVVTRLWPPLPHERGSGTGSGAFEKDKPE